MIHISFTNKKTRRITRFSKKICRRKIAKDKAVKLLRVCFAELRSARRSEQSEALFDIKQAAHKDETQYYAIFQRQKEARYAIRVIHLTPNTIIYTVTTVHARNRHSRGTSNIPLNAARCARLTWFEAIDCTRPIRQHDSTQRRLHTIGPRIGNHPYCSGL